MVFPSHGYRGATLPMAHLASGDLVSLHSLSFLWVLGRRRRYFWRSRLPAQSFLPVGIEEATPLMPYTGDASSVLYWRRLQRLILATPSASYTGDAFSVLTMLGAINLLTLTLALTLTSTLVDAWGVALAVAESLRSRPHHPRGISHMANGMFPHLT